MVAVASTPGSSTDSGSMPAVPPPPELTVMYGGRGTSGFATRVRVGEGNEELSRHDLAAMELTMGREKGDICFPTDIHLSNPHARFSYADGHLTVEDLDSRNGIFQRLRKPHRLAHGDVILVGKHLLRYDLSEEEPPEEEPPAEEPPADAADSDSERTVAITPARGVTRGIVTVLTDKKADGNRYVLDDNIAVIGRREGDIVLPRDRYMSSRHARIRFGSREPVLEDLASRNGTYLRLEGPLRLKHGDRIKLGSQQFRVDFG